MDTEDQEEYDIRGIRRSKRREKEIKRMPKHNLTGVRVIAEQIIKRDKEKLEGKRARESNRRKESEPD